MLYNKFPQSQPFVFERCNRIAEDKDCAIPSHYHNLFEVYYIESGNCSYFIDNKAYHLEPGDIILIPEGIIHNTLYKEHTSSTRLLVNCTRRYIPRSAEAIFSKNNYLYRNHDISGELLEILKQIEKEFSSCDTFSDDAMRSYMHLFFIKMSRNENQYDEKNSQSSYIEEAIDYIQKNLSSEIFLSDIAKHFSVSTEHFSRKFKKETGFGFCEYVNLLRLKRAESLLKHQENMTVSQVAAECGFSDSNYFSVKFKKMYNISPRALQKLSGE